MLKYILLLLISFEAFAQDGRMTFTIQFGEGKPAEVYVGYDGSMHVNPSGIGKEFAASLEQSLGGLDIYRDSVKGAQDKLANQINKRLGLQPTVKFDRMASLGNPFIQTQYRKNLAFENNLYEDIRHPAFNSSLLGKKVEFDASNAKDLAALKSYRSAQIQSYSQLGRNEKFHEAEFSKNIIEIRQGLKKDLGDEELDALSSISQSLLTNNAQGIINSFSLLFKSEEFQKGFASSLVNNFNPASFLYPVNPHCSNSWCSAGELVGDAASLLLGGYEILSGLTLSAGGSGMTLALATIAGPTGGLSTLGMPASAGAVVAGVAMAGHGLSVADHAFEGLYDKINNSENTEVAQKSSQFENETGFDAKKNQELKKNPSKEAIEDFHTALTGQKEPEVIKSLVESFKLDTVSKDVLAKDLVVYRWHNADTRAREFSRFVSGDLISEPGLARKLLALPPENEMRYLNKYTIKEGTTIFRGEVAPAFGQSGGGQQIYIIGDLIDVLKKLD
jgi:hypothetical protein